MQFVALAHDTASRNLSSPAGGMLMACQDVPIHRSANVAYCPSTSAWVPTATQLVGLVHDTLDS